MAKSLKAWRAELLRKNPRLKRLVRKALEEQHEFETGRVSPKKKKTRH